uniref:Uncharacterized protein n=1 Tax=Pseudonaja textilis TaxID=8673 RepID=A0A670YZZ4_PSETE
SRVNFRLHLTSLQLLSFNKSSFRNANCFPELCFLENVAEANASGGSTLLNLDLFRPMDLFRLYLGSSTTTTIPGIDPELYVLTTSKVETSKTTSKLTDAFAKLIKPTKEEQLSNKAASDLSFRHAKVLMFPSTLILSTVCQDCTFFENILFSVC